MQIKNFDQFFRDNPIPMWIYDLDDFSIKDVNQSMVELCGYSRERMLSLTLFDLQSEQEAPKLKKHLAQMDNKIVSDEGLWKHQKKNDEFLYAYVITNPVTVEGENRTYELAMYKDLTGELNNQLINSMPFKHSLEGIMLTNPNGEILQANHVACGLLGMTEKEIKERGREGIIAKDKKLEKALKELAETRNYAGELTFIHKEGQKIPVEVTSTVFKNYVGEKRSCLIFRDISDRKEKEQALRDEQEFSKVLLSSLPAVFFVLDQEGKIGVINEHLIEVLGVPAEKIKGQPAVEFVHESDKEKVPEEIQKVLEEGNSSFEMTLNTAGGNMAIYRFNAEKLEQDNQTNIVGIGVDITKKIELQEQLSLSLEKEQDQRRIAEGDRDKLKKMFEKAPTPKCLLEGREMKFVIANKAYREVAGQEDIIGKRVDEVIPEAEDQGYIDILKQVYDTGEPYFGRSERIFIDKDNEGAQQEYIFNLLYEPLFNDRGEVYGIFVEAMDFSEQIASQEQLKKSLEEKETLLAEIHHRVKNNLAIITSMMELQVMDTGNSKLQDLLRTTQQRIQTIATIHELLYGADSLTQLNFGENITRLVRSLEEVYDSDKQIAITVEADPVPMNINQAIPCALMVNEVVTNAFKHAFKNREEGKIEVKLHENGENVIVKIQDNGVGSPNDFMQETSSSIGMTLIKELNQQLEGEIKFSDNNGTKFELTFKSTSVKGIGSGLNEN